MPTFEADFALTRLGRALFSQGYYFRGAAGFPPLHRGKPGSHTASLDASDNRLVLGHLPTRDCFPHQKDVEIAHSSGVWKWNEVGRRKKEGEQGSWDLVLQGSL